MNIRILRDIPRNYNRTYGVWIGPWKAGALAQSSHASLTSATRKLAYANEVGTPDYRYLILPDESYGKAVDAMEVAHETLALNDANPTNPTALLLPNTTSFSSGTDPEVFATLDGELLPAFEYLPSKRDSYEACRECWETPFWDGFQAEFTTPAGTTCHESLTEYVRRGLVYTYAKARRHAKSDRTKVELVSNDVMEVSLDKLASIESQYKALGCSPSLNAYGTKSNIPANSDTLTLRSAGCHMHYGIQKCGAYNQGVTVDEARQVVQAMDRIAGVFLAAVVGETEHLGRRTFYGVAGEYRQPKYGVEWRVPSARLLQHPTLFILAFDVARFAARVGIECPELLDMMVGTQDEVIEIINGSDAVDARELLRKNRGFYVGMLQAIYMSTDVACNAWNLAMVGAVKAGYFERTVAQNWHLPKNGDIWSGYDAWSSDYRWRHQPKIVVEEGV